MTIRSQLNATEGKPDNIATPLLPTPGRSVYRHGQKMAIYLVKDTTRRGIYSMIRSRETLPCKNATIRSYVHIWCGQEPNRTFSIWQYHHWRPLETRMASADGSIVGPEMTQNLDS